MSAALRTVESWRVAWEHGYLPWLREHGARAWREAAPVLVVVPANADGYFARSLALDAGVSPLGVHFVTPAELRATLTRALGLAPSHPLREHARLLLAIAAEETGGETGAAVAAAPDTLRRAIEVLGESGWDFASDGPPAARPIVARFQRALTNCGFQLLHETDRALLAAAHPVFARVLVIGFDAAHWASWPLLAAAVRCAESATVFLRHPRMEAHDLDAAWVGTWEEHFGLSEPLAGESPAATTTHFLVGRDAAEQARAVVQQALAFLADPSCTRLGILVPGPGALARRIAALLAAHHIPHFDALGHTAPGPGEAPEWSCWLALQETPRLPALLRLLRTCPAAAAHFPADAEDQLSRAFATLLLDDLDTLAAFLAAQPRTAPIAAVLRELPRLPDRATFASFLAHTGAAFSWLGWSERAADLQRLGSGWSERIGAKFSRRIFLRWLGEVLASPQRERAPDGRHPYSRTHLLPAAQAEARTWSHLVIAGLNEGQWPPPLDDAGWLGEDEFTALNIRALNRRATLQGSQGEGHVIAAPGHALCLGPRERRALATRQFLHTLESASHAVALTASLLDEAAPERPCNASEFFVAHYHAARGRVASHETMLVLREETARWLATTKDEAATPGPSSFAEQTRRAFDARRDRAQPFGEYEFARRTPPARPLRLTATDWEKALASPAAAWLQHVLGVAPPDEAAGETPWSQAIGSWVHRWLAAIAGPERGAFATLPEPGEILARTERAADDFRNRVAALLREQGRAIPDWWIATWQQARSIALELARRVAEVRGITHLATEWRLEDTAIAIDAGASLHVRGRIDLLLTPGPAPRGGWIVDYKTGDEESLTPKRAPTREERIAKVARNLRRADGLQLALYALALDAPLGITRLTRDLPLDEPQLMPDDVGAQAQRDFWLGLCRMQDTAIFGSAGKLRDDFSFAPGLPLATLGIDPAILAEKRARTHPHLVEEETP